MIEATALIVVALIGAAQAITIARINAAKRAAETAATYAEPTGNGWAARTEATLTRIESRMDRVEDRLGHLERGDAT